MDYNETYSIYRKGIAETYWPVGEVSIPRPETHGGWEKIIEYLLDQGHISVNEKYAVQHTTGQGLCVFSFAVPEMKPTINIL